MKQRLSLFIVILFNLFSHALNAQKILPFFQIKEISKGKVIVSWINPHKNCIKLSVQRSSNQDFFQTLIWARNPNLYENEFVDKKANADSNWYYRIFYVLKGGNYYFSKTLNTADHLINKGEKSASIKSNQLSSSNPYLTTIYFKPSKLVYSNLKNNITIHLPNAKHHVYRIIFYDENGIELFQMNQVRETELYVDKSNFLHVGWFGFEVYQDDKMIEKNKIMVQAH